MVATAPRIGGKANPEVYEAREVDQLLQQLVRNLAKAGVHVPVPTLAPREGVQVAMPFNA